MTYRTRLYPWCIIRLLPQCQRITVARCRRRNEADAHLKTLRRLIPAASFVIVFDPQVNAIDQGKQLNQCPDLADGKIATGIAEKSR